MGRLARLRAEAEPAGADRVRLYDENVELLIRARSQFVELLTTDSSVLEEVGECDSLLARTHFSRGDDELASGSARDAHAILDVMSGSKALADLLILELEMALRAHGNAVVVGDVEPGELIRNKLEPVQKIVDEAVEHGPRSASEIVARGHMVLGEAYALLFAKADAASHFVSAAGLYQRLDYPSAEARAEWSLQVVKDQSIPSDLMTALDRADAGAATRLEVVRRFDDRFGGTRDAHDALAPGIREALWASLISEARTFVVARRPRWGERQVTA